MSGAKSGSSARASSSSSSPPTKPPQDGRPRVSRTPPALLFPPAPPPLHITVRFSIALPDIQLEIPSPQQTTVVALKHLIRRRLAADADAEAEAEAEASDKEDDGDAPGAQTPSPAAQASRARLRFIHNGHILPDAAVLSAVLKAPPPPPLSHHPDPKGKSPAGAHQQQRVFINCSIGDPLPEADIAAEAEAATAPAITTTTTTTTPKLSVTTTGLDRPPQHEQQNPSEAGGSGSGSGLRSRPRPQQQPPAGFDRLLQAGLTPAEIATLRSHFRAIHTARFTPDTMPSPDTLRSMEDAWLDGGGFQRLPTADSSNGYYYGGGGGGGGGDGEAGEGGDADGVEDAFAVSAVAGPLIQGMLIGFMFPLGVIGWLGKEDGLWSESMQAFVILGVLLSVSVGLVRALTGEG
ncbi:DUF2407 C-terminal domain-containing protein [Thermothelomyces heterothallicus CBS 202.75]|uniref:DUF2407 C-terminal domain-containing protein n=1 Tax=Thermothelomyces heterothallicus CBS 202.75 TaxID=1149848 RepID=UPI003742A4A5